MKGKITTLLVVGIVSLGAATSAKAVNWVTDRVGPIPAGATYVISPGDWTDGGVVIGTTFPAATGPHSIPPLPNPASETIKLPVPPNDFHYGPDVYTDAAGNVTIISAWFVWGAAMEASAPIIVGDGSVASLDVMADFNFSVNPDDPNVVIQKDEETVYDGPLSAVDYASLQLTTVGERGHWREIPTVSAWGVIVMALLVLGAGSLVLSRRRRLTAHA